MLGRYISLHIESTKYGYQFNSIESFDAIEDFLALFDLADGSAFHTKMNIFDFLVSRKYPINLDGSITLKPPYDSYNIINIKRYPGTTCYPNITKPNTLTLGNIDLIYEKFYKNVSIETHYDKHSEYGRTAVAITIDSEKFHKTKSKTIARNSSAHLRIGAKLSDEQVEFLVGRKIADFSH